MNNKLINDTRPEAALVLADGAVFKGRSIGVPGMTIGEVVFNTAMTGYQEILTDPSYKGQLVTLTYPHIGNVGVNQDDAESRTIFASGLIIRDESSVVSNWRSQRSLGEYLKQHGIVSIADVDTRRLTRILRTKGAQPGCIVAASEGKLTDEELDAARKAAADAPVMNGQDLAKVVTSDYRYQWSEGTWQIDNGWGRPGMRHLDAYPYRVVAWDFGIKENILRLLADRGIKVTVVPAQTTFEEAMALNPDGIFLSNGPGDPAPCDYAIEVAKKAIEAKLPLFGICLGHQILGLACGGDTRKMKFGHHGANHPVVDVKTNKVYITSQNHGFMVDEKTLPANAKVTHKSLFDGSLQGFELTDAPVFCFQGHPEASPGPHDIQDLFDRFLDLIKQAKN
ncbi:glutamine-hydrolyzing carbamoyl-phosphate synthase small subunit [Turicimonas sp. TL08]